ncbi:MAG: hypothetical protein HY821_10800 [Acidobacteria bacterium]|nr:hypothetical protein [Acidobacteriota bacterium]
MKPTLLTATFLAAVLTATAGDPKPVDVTIYLCGDNGAPSAVEQSARATVNWMFGKVGVRTAWRVGEPQKGAGQPSRAVVVVKFAAEAPAGVPKSALARALPFSEDGAAITVMYDRIRFIAGRSNREAPILAHVLAHEIAHVLQRTNWHAQTGVMKATWDGQDYDAMERAPLKFTTTDVELIKAGLTILRASR